MKRVMGGQVTLGVLGTVTLSNGGARACGHDMSQEPRAKSPAWCGALSASKLV